jgi:ribonuclease HI
VRYAGSSEEQELLLDVECDTAVTLLLDPHAIHIYTDGSCFHNPGGESGCAAIVHYPDHFQRDDEQILDFGCAESSNNRMELLACIRALEWVHDQSLWKEVARIQILSDSLYVTENVVRARAWRTNRWRNRYGEPVANSDLWKRLLAIYSKTRIRIDFNWVPGKRSPVTKKVDRAAKMAARRGGLEVDRGYKPGAVSRSLVKGSPQRFPARGQLAVIRPYVKKVMAKGENRISFDLFAEVAQTYTASFYAYATPLLAVELHRQHAYRVRFDDDPHYPQIVECIEEVRIPKPPPLPKGTAHT